MARVLLLTLVFAPDGVSTAVLMTELALELRDLGHEVTVLTTTPHYNVEPEAPAASTVVKRWGNCFIKAIAKLFLCFMRQFRSKAVGLARAYWIMRAFMPLARWSV